MLGNNYTKHPTIAVGDRVRCVKPVVFVDNSHHGKNDEFIVTEENLAYFQEFTPSNYEIIKKGKIV